MFYVNGGSGEIEFSDQGALQIRALSYHNPAFQSCTNACEENVAVWVSQSSCKDLDASGGSSTSIHGVIHAPFLTVELGGNPAIAVLEVMIVADSIRIHGYATLNLVANQDPMESARQVFLVQ